MTLKDLVYKKPEIKSFDGLRDLESLKKIEDDAQRSKAWQEWLHTYWREKKEFDEACNQNYSNFCWLVTYLGTGKDELAKKALRTYKFKEGFFVGETHIFEARVLNPQKVFSVYQALDYSEAKEMVA